MNILIIDQLIKISNKIKSIIGWHRDEEEEKENRKIPTIPLILFNRPGSTERNINNNPTDTQNTVFWTKSTAQSEKDVKIKTTGFRKLIKFMRRGSRKRARGA